MIPKIIVKKMNIDLNINLICRPFAERTYLLYPELRGKISDDMDYKEIYPIVKPCVEQVFVERKDDMDRKIEQMQASFDLISP